MKVKIDTKMIRNFYLILVVISFFVVPSYAVSQEEGILLETLGATSAQGLFLTHMAIGTLVDGYAKEAYDKEQATQIIEAYIQISQSTKDSLNKLLTSEPLSDQDAKDLRRIISIYDVLLASAQDVKALIKTGSASHADSYTKNRDKAWKQISSLLGIK
jgi:hypothetical protein